jgi:hypothetical protein
MICASSASSSQALGAIPFSFNQSTKVKSCTKRLFAGTISTDKCGPKNAGGNIAQDDTRAGQPMKLIVKLIELLISLVPLVLIGALILMVEDKPLLQGVADMTPERIARAKQIFEQNDPRQLKVGSMVQVILDQEDLDLAINYFANRSLGGVAGIKVDKGLAVIESTLKLPSNPLGHFLNLKLELKQTETLPEIDHVMLGRLWVPGALAEFLIENNLARVPAFADWQALSNMVKEVKFESQRMIISYQWQNNLPAKLSGAILSSQDQNRIEVYQRRLSELTQGAERSLNLTELTQPLFQLAKTRSNNGEAIAENRALILVLAFYVNQQNLNKILPQSQSWPQPKWQRVTLNNRDDFPRHYLVSAMLAAYAGTPLADAMGLFKEIEDAHGGSGFSFNDIAADRAGTRMGELAAGNEQRKIQMLMATAKESDIMPVTIDLPEFMPETEFKHRFGGVQGKPYRKMMKEIERRIAALPINRDL